MCFLPEHLLRVSHENLSQSGKAYPGLHTHRFGSVQFPCPEHWFREEQSDKSHVEP